MAISIRMNGSEADEELQSLYGWLRDDRSVRGCAHVSLRSAETKPGEMGGAVEAVQVVLDEGFNAANLLLAYLAWRGTRSARVDATIERGDTKISLTNASPETITSIATRLDSEKP